MSKQTKRKRDKRAKARVKGLANAKAAREAEAREAAKKGQPQYAKAATPNGQRIQFMMVKAGWDPTEYKDCVVIISTRLIDWKDSYNITDNEGKPLGPDNALLVHKSKLHGMIPDRMADLFWHKGIGQRVVKSGPPPPPTRRVPVKVAAKRRRKPPREPDVVDQVASALGGALHDARERGDV